MVKWNDEVSTESATETDDGVKHAVVLAYVFTILGTQNLKGDDVSPDEKANGIYKVFMEFLNAMSYTVVKKEV